MGRRAGTTAEATRADLLAATIRVLRTRGYGGARIAEIAREAGVTSGSIYNHFPSKAELIAAAVSEQAPDVIGTLLSDGSTGSVIDAFRKIGATLDEHARTMGPLLLELVVHASRDPEVANLVVSQFAEREALTTEVIRLARDRGEVDSALDVEALARFVTLVALGSLVAGALDLKSIDAASWATVLDRILDSVRPKGVTP